MKTHLKAPYRISNIELKQALDVLRSNENCDNQIIQNLATALYTCDANGYLTFYNDAAAELWGQKPEIGKSMWCGSLRIYQVNGEQLPFELCPMAKALKKGKSVRGEEYIIERPDGVRRNIMSYPDPIFDSSGLLIGAVSILIDITDIKQKEHDLHKSEQQYKQIAKELEKRVEERMHDLKEANSALLRTNEELEQFAFTASHDMQEPLRKIKIFASRLENESKGSLDEAANIYLSKIKASSERMSRLINDILNYSRLSYIDKQFEKTDLNEILKNVLDDFELSIEQKGLAINSERLPVLRAIPLQMNQLFHNIISNSVKFCRDDRPCEIDITSQLLPSADVAKRMLNKGVSYWEIIVKDNGIGFDQEYADKIFKIFERLNSHSKFEGTGIGLALCRKIVNMHRGDIFAESKVNQGTAIHIILPLEGVKD